MFVLKKADTFQWPVTVELPADGGGFEKQTFEVKFHRRPQSWINEILRKAKSEEITDLDAARELVAGWDGVMDDAGAAVEFSDALLEQLLDVPGVASAIVVQFVKASQGIKEGNSEMPRGTGRAAA